MARRKIVYVTGTRAEYGVMRDLLFKIQEQKRFDLSLIVTGMHLQDDFGNTVSDIYRDGFCIAAEIALPAGDSEADMVRSLGTLLYNIPQVLHENAPDIMLLAGDRNEALAGAIAAAHMGIAVVHISGGDTTTGGHIDEMTRHAISKYAHVHFPASEHAARTLIRMGEERERIHVVGNPGVPVKYTPTHEDRIYIAEKYNLDPDKPILLILQHPCSNSVDNSGEQIRETMEAIDVLGHQTIVIYPNNDAGGKRMIEVIEQYRNRPHIAIYKNIPRKDFTRLLALASVLIGNSSCGIIEAPAFSIPVVNIGSRQTGRERADNVIDVNYDKDQIRAAVEKALLDTEFKLRASRSRSPYAAVNAEEKIIRILETIEINPTLLEKSYSG